MLAFVCLWGGAASLYACTERDMLDLIGSLEAPEGYDQVYGGVKLAPPRPITSMTVQEVMTWQRQATKTAVSSAAGRYQVIRETLNGVVKQGVVSLNERYTPAVQDRIGAYLLAQTGYRDGDSSNKVLNRVSDVWAALPRVSGAGAGVSTYEGYAGNHALLDAQSYKQYAACEIELDQVTKMAGVIRDGLRFGFQFDRLIEMLKENAERSMNVASVAASWLLITLFTLDLVGRGLALLSDRSTLGDYIADTFFRLFTVSFFLFLLQNAGAVSAEIGQWAAKMGNEIADRKGFSLGSWAREKFVMTFEHMEGVRLYPAGISTVVLVCSLITQIVMAITMTRIVYTYAMLLFVTVVGMFTVAFGGLGSMTTQAKATIMKILGTGLQIIALNVLIYVGLDIALQSSDASSPVASAFLVMSLDVFIAVMVWTVPASIGRLARSTN